MSNDNFKWTDELVRDFFLETRKYANSYPIQKRIDDFKSSHSSKEEEVGWDIVEGGYSKEFAHPWLTNDKAIESCEKIGCKIFSVRRKSDGVVFTVGEEIDSDYNGKFKITKIYLTENYGLLQIMGKNVEGTYQVIPIISAKPLPKITKPERNGSLSREMEMLEERISYIEKKLNIEG